MLSSVNDRISEATADVQLDGYVAGTVVDNADPTGLGRLKVKVPDLMDPDLGELPWVGQHKLSPFGQGPNYGVYGSPWIGSKVRIKFQQGDQNYGLVEADNYVLADVAAKFRNPKTWGFRDPSGTELFVNMETKAWEFTHASGVSIKYDAAGNTTLTIPGSETKTVDGSVNETVGGDQTQDISGSLTINAGADVTLKSGGTIYLDAPATETSGNLKSGTGWSGTFQSGTGQTVTVQAGIIINVA